jgi:hypothetical protein
LFPANSKRNPLLIIGALAPTSTGEQDSFLDMSRVLEALNAISLSDDVQLPKDMKDIIIQNELHMELNEVNSQESESVAIGDGSA